MTERTRTQRPAGERREQILDAAAEVFAARGIHQSRVDDIATASGVSKGTIYWYFPSKDEIVVALVDAFYAQAHSGLVALHDQPGTVAERLRQYLSSYAQLIVEHQHLAPLATEFYALAPRQHRIRDFLERYYERWTEAAVTLLEQGNRSGELQVPDTWSAARTFVELFDGAFLVWTLTSDALDLNERMQTAFDLLYNGLTGDS